MCTYTSGYFPFYDDVYRCVCYEDDGDHVMHDTQGSVDLRTSQRTTSSTMMGPGGADSLGIHARTCKSYVGKYCAFNLVRAKGHPYDVLKIDPYSMTCMYLHFHGPYSGVPY